MDYPEKKSSIQVVQGMLLCLLCALLSTACINSSSQIKEEKERAAKLLKGSLNYFNNKQYAEAFNRCSIALSIYEETDDKEGQFKATVRMAMLYYEIGLHKEAQVTLEKADKLYQPTFNIKMLIHYYRLSAFIHTIINKNYPKALYSLHRSMELVKGHFPNDTLGYYGDLANIAEVYIHSKNYEKAWQMLDSVEQLVHSRTSPYYSEIYFCRGKILFLRKDYNAAYPILLNCSRISWGNYVINNQVEALGMLTSIDSIKANYADYFTHYNEYIGMKAKLKNSEMTYQMAFMQGQHRMDVLKRESEKAEERERRRTIIMLFTIFVSINISVILWLLYRRSETLKKLSIAEKEKLDAEYDREKLERELIELKYQQSDEKLSEVNKDNVTMSLKLAASAEKKQKSLLDPFEKSFKELNHTFVPYLENHYPALTKYDIRLACFIKMGMSSQDIVTVLNITTSSLNTSRYRLKKKFGLNSEQSIDSFISEIG